jgi:hypothetical protein
VLLAPLFEMNPLDDNTVQAALEALSSLLADAGAETQGPVICGGAALILSGLRSRTTKDIDVVAMINQADELVSPAPLPESLVNAASKVARLLNLPADWINNGPSSNEGGIYQLGLPSGFQSRLTAVEIGSHLTLYLIDRIDQIFFKLYAAAGQGSGRHYDDLLHLNPSVDELQAAAEWTRTHDPSEGFQIVLRALFTYMGHDELATRI